ncbi:MAG: copper oxidase [Chloroflexi bacterium]|nr:MAG: copper oxidase [Chloroflexota bacterium]
MAVKDEQSPSTLDGAPITEPTSANGKGSEPGIRPYYKVPAQRKRNVISPFGVVFIAVVVMIALLSYGLGATMVANNNGASSSTASPSTTSSNTMDTSNPSTAPANVPNATQSYGGQLAKYVVDPDGAKHFTLTAKQVMWEPVKGMKRVLAWTIDGTVPGPVIHVTAADHLRITLINHFPEGTALHWHGLMIPTGTDGVPGVGMKPVMPGQSYTYDFTVHEQDVGTHWYHSHYDDVVQVPGGMYGAFIVDPRPGTPEARQAIHADVEATEFVSELGGYYVINGKSFPDTQPIMVKHGQTVHVRMIGASEMIHPMHLHGHFFNLVAEDGHMLPQPIQKDTLSVTPGDTYDLTFYAWAPPGSIYPFHCHILAHVMNPGQMGTEMGGLIVLVEYAQ